MNTQVLPPGVTAREAIEACQREYFRIVAKRKQQAKRCFWWGLAMLAFTPLLGELAVVTIPLGIFSLMAAFWAFFDGLKNATLGSIGPDDVGAP